MRRGGLERDDPAGEEDCPWLPKRQAIQSRHQFPCGRLALKLLPTKG